MNPFFFEILKDILVTKNKDLYENDEFKSAMSAYMIVKYISNKPNLIKYVNILNLYQGVLDAKEFYILACNVIPKQKSGFIKYECKKNKTKTKPIKNDELVEGQ